MTPLHPQLVHFPLALSIIIPFLAFFVLGFMKYQKGQHKLWLMVVILQTVVVGTGYMALNTGETEEKKVQQLIGKKIIHEHEERAEMFIALAVVSLVTSIIAFFIKEAWQFNFQLLTVIFMLVTGFLSYRTGASGGALVYQYGAASAYATPLFSQLKDDSQSLLPTPGMNTSESPYPIDEDESEADEDQGDEVEKDED